MIRYRRVRQGRRDRLPVSARARGALLAYRTPNAGPGRRAAKWTVSSGSKDENNDTNGKPDRNEISGTAARSERERRDQRAGKCRKPNVRDTIRLPLETCFRRRELRRSPHVVRDDVA
jgi:hypothetical protein